VECGERGVRGLLGTVPTAWHFSFPAIGSFHVACLWKLAQNMPQLVPQGSYAYDVVPRFSSVLTF